MLTEVTFVNIGFFFVKYNHFKIIFESKPFPRALELVRRDLDPRIKQRLKNVLLEAHNDPEAKAALNAYYKTAKFDELDNKARAGLEEVRKILKIVREELK